MKNFRSALWLVSFTACASFCFASAALASEKTRYLKFSSENALEQFLRKNPTSERVHPKLMWVEMGSGAVSAWAEHEWVALGIEKVETDQMTYRIPPAIREPLVESETPHVKLWGISKILAPSAWNVTRGREDVIVAVVDTGIDYNHPALKNNMWINAAESGGQAGVDDDGNGLVDDIHGADFISNNATPMDDEGHGSHVAGTIAGNLAEQGFFGVAPNVRLMAVKTHNTRGEGSKSSVVRGILYAADHGARVLNCSWGGAPEAGEYDQMLFDAIAYANRKGALLVASAGNSSVNNDTGMNFPSNYELDGIISVASSTSTDARSYFSNYGSKTVDLAAPGSNIWSAAAGQQGYVYLSGTSMASPHVAGAAALLASTQIGRGMSAAQLRETLMNNVEKLNDWSGRVISGGRLSLGFLTRD